eukprot:COSAG01_NODE_965_length_12401_cov_3.496098_14_plen_76_part_00
MAGCLAGGRSQGQGQRIDRSHRGPFLYVHTSTTAGYMNLIFGRHLPVGILQPAEADFTSMAAAGSLRLHVMCGGC